MANLGTTFLVVAGDGPLSFLRRQQAKGAALAADLKDFDADRHSLTRQLFIVGKAMKKHRLITTSALLEMAVSRQNRRLARLAHLVRSGLPVEIIARAEVGSRQFPPGHPQNDILYVRHPTLLTAFYPASEYHRFTFEHKFSELFGLLMSLGATEIYVRHVSGWALDVAANSSAVELTLNLSSNLETKSTGVLHATLKGTRSPRLPSDLAWYWHESTWRKVAEGRLHFGLENFSLNLRYEEDFGINAALVYSVEKLGFDLGGRFKEHQSTVWQIEGRF